MSNLDSNVENSRKLSEVENMPETKTICAARLDWSPGAVACACVHLRQLQQNSDNCMIYLVWERDFRCSLPLALTHPNSPWLDCGPRETGKFLEPLKKAEGC